MAARLATPELAAESLARHAGAGIHFDVIRLAAVPCQQTGVADASTEFSDPTMGAPRPARIARFAATGAER